MRLGAKRHIHIRTSHMSKGKVSVLLLLIFFLLLLHPQPIYCAIDIIEKEHKEAEYHRERGNVAESGEQP